MAGIAGIRYYHTPVPPLGPTLIRVGDNHRAAPYARRRRPAAFLLRRCNHHPALIAGVAITRNLPAIPAPARIQPFPSDPGLRRNDREYAPHARLDLVGSVSFRAV